MGFENTETLLRVHRSRRDVAAPWRGILRRGRFGVHDCGHSRAFVRSARFVPSAHAARPRIRRVTGAGPRLWRRLRPLSTQILLLQVAIIVLTVTAGFAVSLWQARNKIDEQAGQESLAIARSVSVLPDVRRAFGLPHPERVIDPIVEPIRVRTRAAFIVVANNRGIRYSHPDKSKIGERISTDPSIALSGKEFVGVQTGTLGRSMRAKVPVYGKNGQVIGLVSVGVLESAVTAKLLSDLPVILIPPLLGLALGIFGSLLLARRIKRQTFGLEPGDIATLLEQREAMLHGIREGTIATDRNGRVTLVNDEARRLLSLDGDAVGRNLAEIVPAGHVREVMAGNVEEPDQIVLVDDHVLVVNRMPVSVRGKTIGAVITLRDRTELEALLRELNDVQSLADALRAQEHEFAHRLHVVAGLIEVGRYDDAVGFIKKSSLVHQALVGSIVDSVGDPILVGLLLGKAAVASERGVELRVGADTRLPENVENARELVTVVANLIDNALDSVAPMGSGWIEVTVRFDDEGILVRVHDSGPGVPPDVVEEIFRDGFTTKVATGAGRRGLGLALVSQAVRRRGGHVGVANANGAVFTVFLPHDRAAAAVR
jgi:two-component system, CitB family, sensor kinase